MSYNQKKTIIIVLKNVTKNFKFYTNPYIDIYLNNKSHRSHQYIRESL